MSTFDDLIVESPLVKAEMARLRDLHGTLEKALELAVTALARAQNEPAHKDAVREVMDMYVRHAERLVGGVAPEPSEVQS